MSISALGRCDRLPGVLFLTLPSSRQPQKESAMNLAITKMTRKTAPKCRIHLSEQGAGKVQSAAKARNFSLKSVIRAGGASDAAGTVPTRCIPGLASPQETLFIMRPENLPCHSCRHLRFESNRQRMDFACIAGLTFGVFPSDEKDQKPGILALVTPNEAVSSYVFPARFQVERRRINLP